MNDDPIIEFLLHPVFRAIYNDPLIRNLDRHQQTEWLWRHYIAGLAIRIGIKRHHLEHALAVHAGDTE